MSLNLNTSFEPAYGTAVEVFPGVRRMTARNPGPMTFHGTNTYLLGSDRLVVIDPGPADTEHFDALKRAVAGRPVAAILLTHFHSDHVGLARDAARAFDAPLVAEGPQRFARLLETAPALTLDAVSLAAFEPDIVLNDGETRRFGELALTGIATPGHAANHMAFALDGTGVLFSGDHVMAWATTVVAPPDGRMSDFMASLDKLMARDDRLYLPGHGGPVERPLPFVRALKMHRRMREVSILDRLKQGSATIPEIVSDLYRSTDVRLHRAAGLSVYAHLEDLCERGLIEAEGPFALEARFHSVAGAVERV